MSAPGPKCKKTDCNGAQKGAEKDTLAPAMFSRQPDAELQLCRSCRFQGRLRCCAGRDTWLQPIGVRGGARLVALAVLRHPHHNATLTRTLNAFKCYDMIYECEDMRRPVCDTFWLLNVPRLAACTSLSTSVEVLVIWLSIVAMLSAIHLPSGKGYGRRDEQISE